MNQSFKIEAKVKKNDKDLKKIIKTCGIEYPHESLAFFSSVYAKFEEPNKNGVELANSVKAQVPQLRGTQVNINHLRKNWIVGTILDAWVVDDEIKIAFSFYKSVYPDLYEQALELLDANELTVSFELKVAKADIETKPNGVKRLKIVSFDGVGLLLGEKPACPEAIVYEQANINQLLEQDLIFANKLKNITKEEDLIVDKKANDALLAKQKQFIIDEFGEDAVKDWTDEDFLNEAKIEEFRKSKTTEKEEVVEEQSETKTEDVNKEVSEVKNEATEEKIEKQVAEEKEDESKEAQVVNEKTTENLVYDVTRDDENGIMEVVETITTIVEKDGKEIKNEKIVRHTLYSQAKVDTIKADYETKIQAKDEEIKFIKEHAKEIADIRAELGDFVKNLSDEELFNNDKIKIARLEKENFELKNNDVSEENASEEKREEEKLETGNEDVQEDENSDEVFDAYVKNRYEQKKK